MLGSVPGGGTLTLTDNATNGTWTSSNPAVATINLKSGIITSGIQGTTLITYANGCGAATTITATVNATPVSINGNAPLCANGSTLTLTNASTNGTWSSSDPTIASVNPTTGVVTSSSGSTVGGIVTIKYDNGCAPAAQVTLTVNALPVIHTFTGGGGYCSGDSGVHIGLTLSQTGISYQLYRVPDITTGSPVAGTGSAISFGAWHTTPGVYYAIATNTVTGCTNHLPGVTVHINALPDTFTITGGGSYCSSDPSGVAIGLTGSATGISYQLYEITAGAIGAPVSGTGSAINFGLHTAGTYTVSATSTSTSCTKAMAGNVVVTLFPSPTIFNVTGGGLYCLAGSGVPVGLDGSEAGTDYQLINIGILPVDTVSGTGAAFNFSPQVLPGEYVVVATNANRCIDTMAGSATLTFSLPPASFLVGGGGSYCLGDTGVHITLSGSAAGVKYQLYRADTAVGTAAAGTGSGLDFGLFTTVGTYSVLATDTASGCTSNMLLSATVSVNPVVAPTLTLNADPANGNRVCYGNIVTFTAQTTNGSTAPAYQWKINNLTITPPDSTYTYIPADGDIIWVKMTSSDLCAIPAIAMDTMIIDVDTLDAPSVFINVSPQTSVRQGESVTLTAVVINGGPSPLYQWYINGTVVAGATGATFTSSSFANGDSVCCRVTTSGGCGGTVTFNCVTITVFGVSVPNVTSVIGDVRLTPNPNKGSFVVSGTLSTIEDAEAHIEIVNMIGQTVYSGTAVAKKGIFNTQIQISNTLANGMYMLNLQSGTDRKVFHFVLEQ